jgi:hypothetical protein
MGGVGEGGGQVAEELLIFIPLSVRSSWTILELLFL